MRILNHQLLSVIFAVLAVGGIGADTAVLAQTVSARQDSYEVVSIKPMLTSNGGNAVGLDQAGNLVYKFKTLMSVISEAYDVGCGSDCNRYILGAPAWVSTQRFEILAKPARPDGLTNRRALSALARPRMRAFLQDRFKLKVRWDHKEMPVYAITVMKGGHKMQEENSTEPMVMSAPGYVIGKSMSIAELPGAISPWIGRRVIDRTGLKGFYHIELMYDPAITDHPQFPSKFDPKSGTVLPAGPNEPERPSIFTALQEQLGLKLEALTAPAPVLIIDHVDLPSEN